VWGGAWERGGGGGGGGKGGGVDARIVEGRRGHVGLGRDAAERAVRCTRLGDDFGQHHRGRRRFGGGLDHDGTSARERRGDLVRDPVEREGGGGDGADRAARDATGGAGAALAGTRGAGGAGRAPAARGRPARWTRGCGAPR